MIALPPIPCQMRLELYMIIQFSLKQTYLVGVSPKSFLLRVE